MIKHEQYFEPDIIVDLKKLMREKWALMNVFLMLTSIFKRDFHEKKKEVCIKAMLTSASRPFKG